MGDPYGRDRVPEPPPRTAEPVPIVAIKLLRVVVTIVWLPIFLVLMMPTVLLFCLPVIIWRGEEALDNDPLLAAIPVVGWPITVLWREEKRALERAGRLRRDA